MAYCRVETADGYTVMSNYHLRDMRLSLKARGLLSQILSLPESWDMTISGLSKINRECSDTIASIIKELEASTRILQLVNMSKIDSSQLKALLMAEQPKPVEQVVKPDTTNYVTERITEDEEDE